MAGIWTRPPSGGWTEEIQKPASGADQVEFGLLGVEQGTDAEEIKMGGLLAVIGQDKKLSTYWTQVLDACILCFQNCLANIV